MRQIKKILAVFLGVFGLGAQVCAVAPASNEPEISAKQAILLDADTLQVLYAKEAQAPAPMASTTKIMTALLLLEAGEPETTLTATDEMVRVEGTSMGLKAGDTVSRYALAAGMLLASGNDAANATAIHLAGTVPAFVEQMNARAKELGMLNTCFVTPSGLDANGHASTPFDMALLAIEALKNPAFAEICGAPALTVSYGNPPYRRTLKNHNRLVRELPGCIGVKTGFTDAAGRCLVSAAERGGRTLICVTFQAQNDWQDHTKLYDYGFAQYHPIQLDDQAIPVVRLPAAGGTSAAVRVVLAEMPVARVRSMPFFVRRQVLVRPFVYAPLAAGSVVGSARYYSGDVLLCEVPLVTKTALEQQRPSAPAKKLSLWEKILHFFKGT